jgi:hypothetical protein
MRAFTVALVAITFLIGLTTQQPAAAAGADDRFYELINRQDGQCLAVVAASLNHAAVVNVAPCYGGYEQQWRLRAVDAGYFQVVARHSGMCLDVAYRRADNNAGIVQASCADPALTTSWNQHWKLERTPGYYRLRPRHTYDTKCLNKSGNSVVLYDCMPSYDWWDQWTFADRSL